MSDSKELGDALERAVRAIEELVIKSDPALSRSRFKITPNAVISRNGERYQIDILVTVNEGTGYETSHLFECKNRKEPASQNDVTLLAEKVRVLRAAKGTLISREFTSCAKAKAESAGVELAAFSDEVWFPITAIESVRFGYRFPRFSAPLVFRRHPRGEAAAPDWDAVACRFRGRELDYRTLIHQLVANKLNNAGVFAKGAGTHTGEAHCAFDFEEGELLIGDWDVSSIELDFGYSVSVYPAYLVSTFSIDRKGRFARFEYAPDEVDGTKLALEITAPPARVVDDSG